MKAVTLALLLALSFGEAIAAGSAEKIVVRNDGGAVVLVSNRPLSEEWKVKTPLGLTIECDGVDCRQIAIETPQGKSTGKPQGDAARSFEIATIPAQGMTLSILVQNRRLGSIELLPEAVRTPDRIERQADEVGARPLQELLTCIYPDVKDYEPYNRDGNYAEFVTNALGTVIAGPTSKDGEVIDEDDTVFVRVLVHPDLLPFMRVKRTSDTRTLGTLNIAGQGTTLERQSDEEEPARTIPVCAEFKARLTDFKSGTGKVRISAQIGDEDQELGTFEFAVSPIFHGMLSFGPFTSDVVHDSFQVAEVDGQSIIVPAKEGSRETRYAVWYTHFVWGGRDLEKSPARWYHRVNPTLGIVTSNLDEHALVGLSVDFGAVVLSAGKHFARGTVISRASGLAVGDAFEGEAGLIPTAKKRDSSTYYAVSVDLRAAAALIKAAFSGGDK